ncbi:MAG: CoA-transferase subunit beta [Actinobacteria bacterium]|nr:CoA-transferase subunit beta [Actinomycetota bacterium]
MNPPTPWETMIVASSRQLAGERVCFVGIGPPNLACGLAKRTVAPELVLIYEAGGVGARPARQPLSIGDPTLVSGALSVTSMFELFAYYLQRGLVDVAFLGASQIDRHGNINTTVIGDYQSPKVRLPGSGGACEIALNAAKVFVIMQQSTRSFVDRVDFVTSPGHQGSAQRGGGPAVVVTQLGVYRFDESGEMVLAALHPGVDRAAVAEHTGWEMQISPDLAETAEPTADELRLLRQELDPEGVYSR